MNELALFAGAGGGILGGKLLGWRTVCAVEINTFCARRLMQRQNEGHLPPFPIWDDVCTFDGLPWRGVVDVVSGGFPCTDISPAGKKAGITGASSSLWKQMARIISDVRPKRALVENSSMLTVRGLGEVLADLASMGFAARWGVLGSINAGGDHDRERTWIVADSLSWLNQMGGDIPRSWWEQKQIKRYTDRETICQPGFLGKPVGMADRMDRNRSIGNGQDPGVVKLAWEILNMEDNHGS